MNTLYLESVAGVAGDMFAAAFVAAGLLDPRQAREVPSRLGLDHARVVTSEVERTGISAVHLDVVVERGDGAHDLHHHPDQPDDGHGHGHAHGHGYGHAHGHAHYPALDALLEEADLPPRAREFSRRVFRILAEAEGRAHGCAPEEVQFHEVGDVDSVIDVALSGLCVAAVEPDRVVASPVRLGRGTVHTRHGPYPVPPPASAYLSEGMPVAPTPAGIDRADVELSTPTGLAILKALDPEFSPEWPPDTVRAVGFGAGTMDFPGQPNVFRVVLLESGGRPTLEGLPYERDAVIEIECNVDDQTGERSGWMVGRSLALGALDAWITPVVGKKGRPASRLTVLVAPDRAPALADWILRHGSTFGVRYSRRDRLKLVRTEERRPTARGPVRFKVGRTTAGEVLKEKPEFDDLEEIWEDDPDFLP